MNIMHLKYALEIAKTGSMNKAAQNLYMGQPNLSRAIKELEASIGITIFDRSTKGMVPTPEGEEFLQHARKILSQIDEIESLYKTGYPSKLRFSVSVPRAGYIAEAFAQFSKKIDCTCPAELYYRETNAMSTIKNVAESEYKLGIIRYAENYDKYFKEMLDQRGIAYELIAEADYILVMSRSHPLAGRDTVDYADLKTFTEIAHADPFVPSLPASLVKKSELPSDIDRRIYIFERGSQLELLSENTAAFMWTSAMPKKLLDCYDLVQKPCADCKHTYRDMLIYRRDYRLTELDNIFITELCDSKRRNIN